MRSMRSVSLSQRVPVLWTILLPFQPPGWQLFPLEPGKWEAAWGAGSLLCTPSHSASFSRGHIWSLAPAYSWRRKDPGEAACMHTVGVDGFASAYSSASTPVFRVCRKAQTREHPWVQAEWERYFLCAEMHEGVGVPGISAQVYEGVESWGHQLRCVKGVEFPQFRGRKGHILPVPPSVGARGNHPWVLSALIPPLQEHPQDAEALSRRRNSATGLGCSRGGCP